MEGAPHTAKNNWCVLEAPPAPVYKGGRGEEAGLGARQVGGNPIGLLVLFAPSSFYQRGNGEGEGEGEGKGGRTPSPCPIRTPHGGRHPLVGCLASPLWPMWPITSPEGFR